MSTDRNINESKRRDLDLTFFNIQCCSFEVDNSIGKVFRFFVCTNRCL